eukprot:251902-Prorocentrum_minimum.AAC.1
MESRAISLGRGKRQSLACNFQLLLAMHSHAQDKNPLPKWPCADWPKKLCNPYKGAPFCTVRSPVQVPVLQAPLPWVELRTINTFGIAAASDPLPRNQP